MKKKEEIVERRKKELEQRTADCIIPKELGDELIKEADKLEKIESNEDGILEFNSFLSSYLLAIKYGFLAIKEKREQWFIERRQQV